MKKYGAKHRTDILFSLVIDALIKTQHLCSIPTNNVYVTLNIKWSESKRPFFKNISIMKKKDKGTILR